MKKRGKTKEIRERKQLGGKAGMKKTKMNKILWSKRK
jgi:hypothetical protein